MDSLTDLFCTPSSLLYPVDYNIQQDEQYGLDLFENVDPARGCSDRGCVSCNGGRIQYEAKNPEMKFGAGMRKSARKAEKKKTKKAKKEERKEAKKAEKAKKEAQKIAKIRNDRRGAVDLLEGEDIGHVVG
ncbi:hypothetical protein ACEPAH_2892 [Sanghuangporus vaninii]